MGMSRLMISTGIMLCCVFPVHALEQRCEGEVCLHQPGLQVTFLLNENCSVGGSQQTCIDSVNSAMEVWNAPECSDLEILFRGTTPRVDIGYSQENPDDNINLIYVVDADWSHTTDSPRVGTITHDMNSGAILDYDVEVNNQYLTPTEDDLHNMLARDFGMALGFDKNSGEADSIIKLSLGEAKKTLTAGDSQALCQLYPLSEHEPPRSSGCICGTTRGSMSGCLFLLVSIVLLRGRRSRRDRSPGGRTRCRRTR
jgi:hypothetical protein